MASFLQQVKSGLCAPNMDALNVRAPLDGFSMVDVDIDLSATGMGTVGADVNAAGVELHYLVDGSSPGGRVTIVTPGGTISHFAPGQVARGTFSRFTVIRDNFESAYAGNARFRVVSAAGGGFQQPFGNDIAEPSPVPLLGTDVNDTTTWITLLHNTGPSSAASNTFFRPVGCKALRVFGLSFSGGNLPAADIVPWIGIPTNVDTSGSGATNATWFPAMTGTFNVQVHGTGDNNRVVFGLPLSQYGFNRRVQSSGARLLPPYMYLEFRPTSGALTEDLKAYVEGLF